MGRRMASCASSAPAVLLVVLAAQLLLSCGGQRAQQQRACEESGMCSVGVSKKWVGEVKQVDKLKEMLESVTFKKELIITVYMRKENAPLAWQDQVIQLHYELLELGFAHHVFMTMQKSDCDQIEMPSMSCIWDSTPYPHEVAYEHWVLWLNRWKFITRSTRLGYNVMSVDTDFMFFRDPYVHLKRAPLRDLQLVCTPEGGLPWNCNAGFVYIQNVRPDGPITWALKEVLNFVLRVADDGFEYISQFNKKKESCLLFEQWLLMDAMVSAAVGRPMLPMALRSCKPGTQFTTRKGGVISYERMMQNLDALVSVHLRVKGVKAGPDPAWLQHMALGPLPDEDSDILVGNLTVPNLAYGFPEELGGRFGPEKRGELSRTWEEVLRSDCPSCAWWPENRPLKTADDQLSEWLGPNYDTPQVGDANGMIFVDPTVPSESFGHAPRWLVVALGFYRRGLVLGKKAPMQGPLIMTHVHVWHLQTGSMHKTMLRKVLGRYNWTLGMEFARRSKRPHPYLARRDVTRVLALSPSVDLARTRSWHEMASIIAGLMQVARLSRRTLLMPDLPCETAWLHDDVSKADAVMKRMLCVAPTFWKHPDRFPLPLTVAVDDKGELVGGWARRRRGRALTASGAGAGEGTVFLAPWEDAQGQEEEEGREQEAWQSAGAGRWQQAGDGSSSSSSSAGSAGRGVAVRRHLRRLRAESLPPGWWARQRYVEVMPQFWDTSCTADENAIISAEFFHWLKHSESGRQAQLAPSPGNTIFTPAPAHAARLRPKAGPTSRDVPRGEVVPAQEAKGWSFADLQVALPVAQVAKALQDAADVPLLYLGHPVMVVGAGAADAGGDAQLAAAGHDTAPQQGDGGGRAHLPPAAQLLRINGRITRSRCKAVWDGPNKENRAVHTDEAPLSGSVVAGSAPSLAQLAVADT